jgi:hypothetical protein
MEQTITISTKEYTELKESQYFLESLQANGVDNWEGYGDAIEYYHENYKK